MRRAIAQGRGGSASRRPGVVRQLARLLADPADGLRRLLVRLPVGGFQLRCDLDLYRRPHYAYCVLEAARLGERLGLPAITVAELGVAGGNGLVEMEAMAALASTLTGVRVDAYGFDLGSGLPAPADYRDLPYHWQSGFFAMDVAALRERLHSAQLILGDLSETVPAFNTRTEIAPLGFVAIDVDFYSSAAAGLRLFDASDDRLLPRVLVYLDDVVGEDYVLHSHHVGELAAVDDYNARHKHRKIAKVNGLSHKRIIKAEWCDSIFALHAFEHPLYSRYVGPPGVTQQRPL